MPTVPLVAAAVAAFLYAVVNAFGAWAVVRRKSWVALLFMTVASLLTVAGVTLLYRAQLGVGLLAVGLALASLTSLINAWVVLGKVVWRFHAVRLAVGLAIFALAWLGA